MTAVRESFFNYRPLTCAAIGFGAGIVLSMNIMGIPLVLAVCLFAILGALTAKTRRALSVMLTFAALGALRCMLSQTVGSTFPVGDAIADIFMPCKKSLAYSMDVLFAENAPLIKAILLGMRDALAESVYSIYRDSGIAHVLALSGLHVSILTGVILLLIPKCYPRFRFGTAFVFLFAYCAIAAFPSSLLRASIMTLYYLAASCFNRRRDALSAICAAFITILVFLPEEICSVGFQMSFAAVTSIALLYKSVSKALHFFPDAVCASLSVTICGTIGTLPLTLYHFRRISTYALFANLILLPFVPFALIGAFIAVVIYPVSAQAAYCVAYVPRLFLSIITYFAQSYANLPFAVLTYDTVSIIAVVLFYPALVVLSPYILCDAVTKKRVAAILMLLSAFSMLFAYLLK